MSKKLQRKWWRNMRKLFVWCRSLRHNTPSMVQWATKVMTLDSKRNTWNQGHDFCGPLYMHLVNFWDREIRDWFTNFYTFTLTAGRHKLLSLSCCRRSRSTQRRAWNCSTLSTPPRKFLSETRCAHRILLSTNLKGCFSTSGILPFIAKPSGSRHMALNRTNEVACLASKWKGRSQGWTLEVEYAILWRSGSAKLLLGPYYIQSIELLNQLIFLSLLGEFGGRIGPRCWGRISWKQEPTLRWRSFGHV